jgi:hypothetical protein
MSKPFNRGVPLWSNMPKRVFGICPDCGRYINKRGGKLRVHFPTDRRRGGTFINPRPEMEDLCPGSGKKVVSQ